MLLFFVTTSYALALRSDANASSKCLQALKCCVHSVYKVYLLLVTCGEVT